MKYLNELIEGTHSLFTRTRSRVITAMLVTLVGVMIGVGVYGCKKEEPVREDVPTELVEPTQKESPL